MVQQGGGALVARAKHCGQNIRVRCVWKSDVEKIWRTDGLAKRKTKITRRKYLQA
jgi:hypothetical protein